jgi:hypothetical protein
MTILSHWRKLSGYEKALALLFLLTLPLVNPWVRGDGVGYYAYVRAPLIEHSFDFTQDWSRGNATFQMAKLSPSGTLLPGDFTSTGHVDNHFTVGPALLWTPFLLLAQAFVLVADKFGAYFPADGFSRPYIMAMALATALYGFLGLWLSFRIAVRYFSERWAAISTIGIWFASSLFVYMYFNPSWSHAHSAFTVALFVWYWHRTRGVRSLLQWILLGLAAGLMLDVYYPNGLFLLLPLAESISIYLPALCSANFAAPAVRKTFVGDLTFLAAIFVALLPTFITREIVYGNPWKVGSYTEYRWYWSSPALSSVLFSSDHGLFTWTPLLLLAVLGFFLFARHDRLFGCAMIAIFLIFWYVISSYPYWDGLSSFGNRFFISFTPFYVLGLTATLSAIAHWFARRRARFPALLPSLLVFLAILWNLGFVFQWGTHLIPVRGPISWREMAYNQLVTVPERIGGQVRNYLFRRQDLMRQIEQEDIRQIEKKDAPDARGAKP